MSDLTEPTREAIRNMILADMDIPSAVVHFANGGLLDTHDLWWLYDELRIMASGDAWPMAMLWEDTLTDDEADPLSNPYFWEWFDRGRR